MLERKLALILWPRFQALEPKRARLTEASMWLAGVMLLVSAALNSFSFCEAVSHQTVHCPLYGFSSQLPL